MLLRRDSLPQQFRRHTRPHSAFQEFENFCFSGVGHHLKREPFLAFLQSSPDRLRFAFASESCNFSCQILST